MDPGPLIQPGRGRLDIIERDETSDKMESFGNHATKKKLELEDDFLLFVMPLN